MDSISLMNGFTGVVNADIAGLSIDNMNADASGTAFSDMLGGLMMTPQQTEAELAIVEEESTEEVLPLMLPQTENALSNFIANYLSSKEDEETDKDVMVSQLRDMLDTLSGKEISMIMSFNAAVETALFGGGKNENEKNGASDILSGMLENIKLSLESQKEEKTADDIIASLAVAGGISPVFAQIDNTDTAEENINDTAIRLVSEADDDTVTEMTELINATVSEYAEEKGITPNEAELGSFSEFMSKQTEDFKASDIVDVNYTPSESKIGLQSDFLDRFANKVSGLNIRRVDYDAADDLAAAQNIPTDIPTDMTAVEEHEPINVQIMQSISDRIDTIEINTSDELIVRLDPESLGEIKVTINKDANGNISVSLEAKNEETAHLIDMNRHELVTTLREKGAEVSVNVVDPSEQAQYSGFGAESDAQRFLYQNGDGGNGRNRRNNDSDDDDSISSVEAVSSADETNLMAEEADLWTTA